MNDNKTAIIEAAFTELIKLQRSTGKTPEQVLFEAITRMHRTQQQETVAAIAGFLKLYANAGNDARNNASVNYAKRVTEAAGDTYFPFI